MSKAHGRRFETVFVEGDKAPDIAIVCKLIIQKLNRGELNGIDKREIRRIAASDSENFDGKEYEN